MIFYKENDFKHEIIGDIPQDWAVVRLEEIVTLLRNGLTVPQNKEGDGYPITRIETISEEKIDPVKVGFVNKLKESELAEFMVDEEDILFSHINSLEHIGKTAIYEGIPKPLIHGMNLLLLRPDKNRVYPKFLLYLLRLYRKKNIFRAMAKKAVNQASINQTELGRVKVIIPSLEEQRGVVGVLGVVDLAIAKTGEVIAKTERLKKGLMQTLLTRGIGHKEYKQTPIGTTPKEWEIVKLQDVSFDFIGGGTPSTSNPDFWDGDIAWMTSAHINGTIIMSGQRYITKKGLENSASHLIPKDNLLVATRVGIGKAAINKIDIAISQDLTGVIVNKEKALPEFLYWVIINNERRLKSIAQGSTIKGILREDLGRLSIPRPPLPEQQAIAEFLSTVDKKLELERSEKARLERIKRGLMDLLLTGKIRVKVGQD